MEQGLEILIREGHVNVIVEGDSTLVIRTTKRRRCGTNIGKVIKHWCLAQILQIIQKHLQTLFTVEFRWVRRSKNALVDRLVNKGVNCDGDLLDNAWTQILVRQLRLDCEHLTTQDQCGIYREDRDIDENERHAGPTWDPEEL